MNKRHELISRIGALLVTKDLFKKVIYEQVSKEKIVHTAAPLCLIPTAEVVFDKRSDKSRTYDANMDIHFELYVKKQEGKTDFEIIDVLEQNIIELLLNDKTLSDLCVMDDYLSVISSKNSNDLHFSDVSGLVHSSLVLNVKYLQKF